MHKNCLAKNLEVLKNELVLGAPNYMRTKIFKFRAAKVCENYARKCIRLRRAFLYKLHSLSTANIRFEKRLSPISLSYYFTIFKLLSFTVVIGNDFSKNVKCFY